MAAPSAYARRSIIGNAAATTVPLGIGSGDGSCALASGTNWPSGSVGPFLVVIDRGNGTLEEKAWCSGTSGTTLTFSLRGAEGTTAQTHAAGCTIALCTGSTDGDEANQVVNQVLGQSGAAKGDLLAMLSAAGPNTLTRVAIGTSTQYLGVSSGLPAWATPANGYGVTGFAANPMTPAISLSTSESYIGSNVNITSSATNITSVSLTAGTWDISFRAVVNSASNVSDEFEMWIGPTSASTTSAYAGTAGRLTGASTSAIVYEINLSGRKIVTLGSTTTVYLIGYWQGATTATAFSTTGTSALPNASGITAVRIA